MKEISEILLRRRNKISLDDYDVCKKLIERKAEPNKNSTRFVLAIEKNIETLGFKLSTDAILGLSMYSEDDLQKLYFDLIGKLRPLVGADKKYKPMYPNFPEQVAEASEAELFINAVIHYLTDGEWISEYEKTERMPLLDDVSLTTLELCKEDEIFEVLNNLLSSKTSISNSDKEDVRFIIQHYSGYEKHLPETIPLKENVALFGEIVFTNSPVKDAKIIQKYYKTSTDVLRLVAALSDGDISLAEKCKFRKLRRYERRMIMDLLSGCSDILEDMFRYRNEWIRIGEIIHPFEFKNKKYSSVVKAFESLRNEKKPLFLPGQIQENIKFGHIKDAVSLLQKRPGDFARQLDKLVRDADDYTDVLEAFSKVAMSVSVPVLLQVRQHFMTRNNGSPIRVFFPKGNATKAVSITNEMKNISNRTCSEIVRVCDLAIIEQFKKSKEEMGTVYINPVLKNYTVPFSQRSASKAAKQLTRGSRVDLGENTKVCRGFIWWTNNNTHDRVDIDLSASIYDKDFNYVTHISYTNLKDKKILSYHSGDIVNGGSPNGKGAAEFIDIDVNQVPKVGKYVVFQVYSFTGQPFSSLKNCRFGWMERQKVKSGEIFEPSTVEMSIDLTSDLRCSIPVIFDCETKEAIWCDLVTGNHYGLNNLESNKRGVKAALYAIANFNKPNLFDLVRLNCIANGKRTYDRDEADIIFDIDKTPPMETVTVESEDGDVVLTQRPRDCKIITPYDLDYVMGKLL